jgi:hypothetical protein
MKSSNKSMVLVAGLMAAAIASTSFAAGTSSITTTASPADVLILSSGTGLVGGEYFGPLTVAQFGSNSGSGITDKITSIQYTVASYPGATSDSPLLCYYTPYTATSKNCISVTAGTTAATQVFNNLQFGPGAEVSIVHNIKGTPSQTLKASGKETVVFNYSY